MDNLPALVRRNIRIALFFLSLGCLGLAMRPDWEPVIGGFLVGCAGSLLMSLHLAWKVSAIGKRAAAGLQSGKRPGSFGLVSRAAIGVLAALISVRYLAFDLPATAAGLLTTPLVTLLLGLKAITRSGGHSSDERGENQ